MAVIIWLLDLHLPMWSVPITTKVACLIPDHGEGEVKVIGNLCRFKPYFSYIVTVTDSFIGAGNLKNTNDLPHVTDKFYHIKSYWVHLPHGRESNMQLLWW
jgi:hypothetical protein